MAKKKVEKTKGVWVRVTPKENKEFVHKKIIKDNPPGKN